MRTLQVLQETGTEAAKKICDFRKCLCRAVSSQPLQTRSCLLHSILWYFFPFVSCKSLCAFSQTKAFRVWTNNCSTVSCPLGGGCGTAWLQSDHRVPRAERGLHFMLSYLWRMRNQGSMDLMDLYYCLETRPTALSSIHTRTSSLCTREEVCNSKGV